MNSASKILSVLVAALILGVPSGWAALPEMLKLEAKIPLGAVRGRIDHLAVDLARHRLFVAELGNGSLGVVDLDQGKLLRRIDSLAEPQSGQTPDVALLDLNLHGELATPVAEQ